MIWIAAGITADLSFDHIGHADVGCVSAFAIPAQSHPQLGLPHASALLVATGIESHFARRQPASIQ